jgi:glycosyltransferase involved in cell wall biosynthesis
MKDLIWLSHFVPFPPRGGAPQRSYNLIRVAAKHFRVHLVMFNRPSQEPAAKEKAQREFEKFCHRVEFWEMPYPWRGGEWWLRLMASPFQHWPHVANVYDSSALQQRWRALLSEYPDAIVHIDTTDLAPFVRPALTHRVVLNHHNCESAMLERRAQVARNPAAKIYFQGQAWKQRRLEAELCPAVAMNLTVSETDTQELRKSAPTAPCMVVENGTDTDYFHPMPELVEPNSLIFAGSLGWHPNNSGLQFFRREIWPLLEETKPKLYIAGQNPQPWMKEWAAAEPRVQLIPGPEDIRPWIARGAVYVCPIIDGGGTRLKLLDAMAMAKAIVSTDVGCEGLDVHDGVEMLIASDAKAFAAKTLELLRDRARAEVLSQGGLALVMRRFAWSQIEQRLVKAYGDPIPSPPVGVASLPGQRT